MIYIVSSENKGSNKFSCLGRVECKNLKFNPIRKKLFFVQASMTVANRTLRKFFQIDLPIVPRQTGKSCKI